MGIRINPDPMTDLLTGLAFARKQEDQAIRRALHRQESESAVRRPRGSGGLGCQQCPDQQGQHLPKQCLDLAGFIAGG